MTSTEQETIEALLKVGCGDFVVCGGARNAGLVALLKAAEGLQIWKHFEERGAAFFALGRAKDHGQPCAVVTTSGTAVAECLPAVIEAHYTCKPLIVLSADRPIEFRGSGAPQVIEQEGIFGSYAATSLEEWDGHGPLHLNVPLEEGEVNFGAWKAKVEGFLPRRLSFEVRNLRDFLDEGVFRGIIAMVGGLEPEDREDVFYFLKELRVPVVADVNSGIREALGDLLVPEGVFLGNLPGRILRLGEVPVGRLWRDLENQSGTEVLSICRNGLPGLARESKVIHGEVGRVIRGYGPAEIIGDVRDDFLKARPMFGLTDEKLESLPDSEPGLVNLLSVYATTGESLFIGNSLPIREWNDFGQRETPYARVFANRGANGIDGQVSTWLGATAETGDSWGVFGDLTALYDLAAPAMLSQVACQGRVLVVINNSGGRIFDGLPRLAKLSENQKDALVQPQEMSLKGWAEMWGMDYLRIENREGFDDLEAGAKTLLVELVPDPVQSGQF
ncbi:MAG: 2-succinyl-5-enolpyruvyl-6-hydroxy-3-cyclohexene-1-carboxylate synthase [Akkermansiaceae bacterium]|jgi:2-succinyl-5-enolpyruvyl-6-hydroxy-3-cyclohexene-1-carboxylate synthase